ncbi:hypothetical protein ABIE67_008010 [Streptomyces sp. V4I8]
MQAAGIGSPWYAPRGIPPEQSADAILEVAGQVGWLAGRIASDLAKAVNHHAGAQQPAARGARAGQGQQGVCRIQRSPPSGAGWARPAAQGPSKRSSLLVVLRLGETVVDRFQQQLDQLPSFGRLGGRRRALVGCSPSPRTSLARGSGASGLRGVDQLVTSAAPLCQYLREGDCSVVRRPSRENSAGAAAARATARLEQFTLAAAHWRTVDEAPGRWLRGGPGSVAETGAVR